MHLLLVNLYEFGLFLRILLWISVPLIVVTLLVTTWLHYRGRRKAGDELRLSMEGMDISAAPEDLLAAIQGRVMSVGVGESKSAEGPAGEEGVSGEVAGGTEELSERERNRMYKGILWMKEKYEQYRDLADQRIEQLKDELVRAEKRYQDLLDQRMEGPAPERFGRVEESPAEPVGESLVGESTPTQEYGEVRRQLEEKDRQLEESTRQHSEQSRQLEEKDRRIEDLESQLQTQWQKTEELIVKLQNSSQLLLKISQELEGSAPSARF